MKRFFKTIVLAFLPLLSFSQNPGDLMFVGYTADGGDEIAFITFYPIPNGTTYYINDNEWNGLAIGSGGAFNSGEGILTWTNNTGYTISAGIVITIQDNGPITTNYGSVSETGNFNIGTGNEVIYLYSGSDLNTPTIFYSALANDEFNVTNGVITNTGLTSGVSAININGDEDIMVYTGSFLCDDIATCSASIGNLANWDTDDGGGDQSGDGNFPDYPNDLTPNFYGSVFQSVTYYSRNATSGGDWDDPNSWTTVSNGTGGPLPSGFWPASSDNAVILNGHTITIDDVMDNLGNGISPNGLGRSNVGTFTQSGDQMFYHTGNILIRNGGILNSGEELMLEGYNLVAPGGTLTVNEDIVVLGDLEISSGATFTNTDDLICSGISYTTLDNTSIGADDIYMDHTDALLCGEGLMNLGNGGADPTVQFFNGATTDQICDYFNITCTSNCGGFNNGPPTGNFLTGRIGPGGVGNRFSNELWLKANDLALSDGDPITNWPDASGNSTDANANTPLTATNQPTFTANSANSVIPSISFDGGDLLNLGSADLDYIPQTDDWSFFVAFNVSVGNQGTFLSKAQSSGGTRQYQYTTDGPNRYTAFMGGSYNQGTSTNATGSWSIGASLTQANANGYDSWLNASSEVTSGGVGTSTLPGTDVLIGARRVDASTLTFGFTLTGEIGELIMYDLAINDARRIIVQNYLAAKYDIDISASGDDVYTMDDNAGEYDFEAVGIGQASDGTNHRDSEGDGILRVWRPSDLDNDEFLMLAHNGIAMDDINQVDVDGVVLDERLNREWGVSEFNGNDVGTVNLAFDLSEVIGSTALGSNLLLAIDRDGDGFADLDVTPVSGAFIGNTIIFSDVNLQDGDIITIANTDLAFPLPFENFVLTCHLLENEVNINWISDIDENGHFIIQKSQNMKQWNTIAKSVKTHHSNYFLIDKEGSHGINYYRIGFKPDGSESLTYSNIDYVEISDLVNQISDLKLFPNPNSGSFTIEIDSSSAGVELIILNQIGEKVDYSSSMYDNKIRIQLKNANPGYYSLRLISDKDFKSSSFIIH